MVGMAGVVRCWRVVVMGKGGVVKKTQGRGRRKRREDRKKGSGKAGKRGLGFGVRICELVFRGWD